MIYKKKKKRKKKKGEVQRSAWTHQEYYSPTLTGAGLFIYFFSLRAPALRRGSNLYCPASDDNRRSIISFFFFNKGTRCSFQGRRAREALDLKTIGLTAGSETFHRVGFVGR